MLFPNSATIRHEKHLLGSRVVQAVTKSLDQKAIAMQITVTRYGARHWAVYLNGQLLAVTVYKKGALAVQDALRPSHSLKSKF